MTNAVTIKAQDIPGFPGMVHYDITGLTSELVQREITRLFNQVEQSEGYATAEFDNPKRINDRYFSQGYTFVGGYDDTQGQ